MRTLGTALFPLIVAALVGCNGSEPDGAQPGEAAAQDQDFVSRGGATLKVAGDPGLRISLMMFAGVKPRTKNHRFIKATVQRGSKSFGAFCNLHGDLTNTTQKAVIGCSYGITTVSNDDDEFLAFDIALERTSGGETLRLERVGYSGDGTFLDDQVAILGHVDEAPLPLTVQEANNADKNALLFARQVLDGTAPLLSEQVFAEEVDQPVAVKSAGFTVDHMLNISTVLRVGRTGRLSVIIPEQSLLKTPGDLSKGVLDETGITARLKSALPQ